MTGEHAIFFAQRFPALEWQPSDINADALGSIAAWQDETKYPNLRPPLIIDAGSPDWPIDRADAVLSIRVATSTVVMT